MVLMSEPKTLTPTGVRMPVVSMSTRFLMGIVHALETPGRDTAWFIWSISSSCEMWSGVMWRNRGVIQSGAQAEYQVSTLRHSLGGFSVITVSAIESGAGSVDDSARPALP